MPETSIEARGGFPGGAWCTTVVHCCSTTTCAPRMHPLVLPESTPVVVGQIELSQAAPQSRRFPPDLAHIVVLQGA